MNLAGLRKLALQTANLRTNPKSKFAHLSDIAKERLINQVYKDNMTDDELFSAISDRIQQYNYPKNPNKQINRTALDDLPEVSEANPELERQANRILAENPEEIGEDVYYLPTQNDFEYSTEEELLNLLAENENIKKAQAYDERFRKEYAIYDKQHYQPTKGSVWHIRKSDYKPQPQHQQVRALISELLENQDDPFASGIDTISDLGAGVSPDQYKQYLDLWRNETK